MNTEVREVFDKKDNQHILWLEAEVRRLKARLLIAAEIREPANIHIRLLKSEISKLKQKVQK